MVRPLTLTSENVRAQRVVRNKVGYRVKENFKYTRIRKNETLTNVSYANLFDPKLMQHETSNPRTYAHMKCSPIILTVTAAFLHKN